MLNIPDRIENPPRDKWKILCWVVGLIITIMAFVPVYLIIRILLNGKQ